ncbi:MAG: O-antigen ligase family protein [Opitutales bacterium]
MLVPLALATLAWVPLIVLGLWPNASTRLYQWPETALLQICQLGLLAVGLAAFSLRRARVRGSAPWLFQLAAFGWILGYGQSLFTTAFPTRAALGMLGPLSLVCTAYIVHAALSSVSPEQGQRVRRWLLRGLALTGGITSVASLGLWLGDVSSGQALGRNAHPFGHASQSGGFGLLTLVCGLCLLAARWREHRWQLPRHPDGVLGLAACLGGAFLIFSSQSRGALLGLGLMGLILLWRYRPVRWRHRLGVLASGLVLVAVALAVSPRLQQMALGALEGELIGSDTARLSYAQTAWSALVEAPLTGYGAFTTDLSYPLFWGGEGRLGHAYQLHSLPMQVLWDGGGLAGLGLAFAAIGLVGASFRRRTGLVRFDPSVGLAAAGMVGWLVYSLGDASLEIPVMALLVGSLLAMAVPASEKSRGWENDRGSGIAFGRLLRWGGGLLLASGWFVLVQHSLQTAQARSAFACAVDAFEADETDVFVRQAENAARAEPTEPLYPGLLGTWLAQQARETTDPGEAQRLRMQAREALEDSLRIWPTQELPHSQLGWLLMETDPRAAVRHLQQACRLNPTSPVLWVGLSRAWLGAGRADLARDALLLQLLAQPAFMTADVWHHGDDAAGLRRTVGEAFLETNKRLMRTQGAVPPAKVEAIHTALRACWGLRIDLEAASADALLRGHFEHFLRTDAPTGSEAKALGLHVRRALRREPTAAELRSIPWPAYPPLPTETAAALATLRQMADRAGTHVSTVNRRTAYPLLARNLDIPAPADPPVVTRKLARALLFEPLLPTGALLSGQALRQEAEQRGLFQAPAAWGERDSTEQNSR